jgi:hypothetical protein
MRKRTIFSLIILGWQLLAALLGFVGQVDMLLASWPDPNWYIAVLTLLLRPPVWLVAGAVIVALWLLGEAWLGQRTAADGRK